MSSKAYNFERSDGEWAAGPSGAPGRGDGNLNVFSFCDGLPNEVASPAGGMTRSLVALTPLTPTTGEAIGLGPCGSPPFLGPIAVAPTPSGDTATLLPGSPAPTPD
ncbi:MAG: hypothetical protein KDJ52_24945 [Anaerolineae bacterium]|nr:hypothetical protein [Anaerolineae bacterium]